MQKFTIFLGFAVPETYDCIEVLSNVKKWTEIPVMFNVFLVIVFFFSYLYGLPNYVRSKYIC